MFINLYHGRRSFEIGLEIGRIGLREDEEQPYSMSALLSIAGFPDVKKYMNYVALTQDAVNNGLRRLAKLFQVYVTDELLTQGNLFKLLEDHRKAALDAYVLEMDLEHARRDLVIAWQSKDYKSVVSILTPLYEHLTPSERKKLQYAQRMTLN